MTQLNDTYEDADVGADGRGRRVALISVAALLSTVTMAISFMLGPLLPLMQEQYSIGVSAATWIFTALALGSGAGFVLIPRLQDVAPERAVFLGSGAVLVVGALAPAIVDSYAALVVGATLLGFGSAAQMLPVGFLRRHLSGSSIATAVSVLIMATGGAVVLGMVGSGFAVKYLSLSAFFYVLAASFLVTTIALLIVVPPSRPASSAKIGVFGTAWLIAWVAVVLLAISQISVWSRTVCLVLFAVGIAMGIAWALSQRNSPTAVFDLSILKQPFTTTAFVASFLIGAIDAAFVLLVSYYTQTPADVGYGLGMDALGTSLLMIPFALTMLISGKLAERVIQQGRPAFILAGGAIVCALGLAWMIFAHDHAWQYLIGAGLVGLGSRAGYSGAFAIPQLVVPEEKAGMAAGIPGTIMMIGAGFGTAVITLVLSSAYVPGIPGLPENYLYTVGYAVSLLFPLGILVAVGVSSVRHPGAFRALIRQA